MHGGRDPDEKGEDILNRIDRILQNDLFLDNLSKNAAAEADRRFCRHDMRHFLDVARIGQIINLEEQLALEKELIYAAGLLHDIGKHMQYSDDIPHERASAMIAPDILLTCGFDEAETGCIVDAILSHRDEAVAGEKNLRGVLYRADKASRACFACKVEKECNWKDGKKNWSIRY